MSLEPAYWSLLEPVWEAIDIYHGPDIFAKTFTAVPLDVGLLFAAHWCQSEVCNGGLLQFFNNSTGVLAPEAVEGFWAIGQPELAGLVLQAMAMLGAVYERERQPRQELVDLLPDDAYRQLSSPFSDLNERFFELIRSEAGGFKAAADQYAATISV